MTSALLKTAVMVTKQSKQLEKFQILFRSRQDVFFFKKFRMPGCVTNGALIKEKKKPFVMNI